MTTLYILIVASFLINLILILALRLIDKKDKSLKSVNSKIAGFRSEVNSTLNRVRTSTQDCEERINFKLDEAHSVINSVAETLDILQVHQKELSELSDVCKNYENALNSLKIQTEQAESRIQAVQSQIRTAKEFTTYINQFMAEAEKIKNELAQTRQDYSLLVADTQTKLKSQAILQQDENNRMLENFSSLIEKKKLELGEFSSNERNAFMELCYTERDNATKHIKALEDRANAIYSDIESSKNELEAFRNKLSQTLETLSSQQKETVSEFERIRSEAILAIKKESESEVLQAEEKLNRKKLDINEALDSFSEKLQEKEKKVDEAIRTLEAKKELAKDTFESSLESSKKQLDLVLENLNKEKERYDARCRESLNQVFNEVVHNGQEKADELKLIADGIILNMGDDIASATRTVESISSATAEKIEESIEELSQLKEKIEKSRAEYYSLTDGITNRREELWELNNDHSRMLEENQKLSSTIKDMKDDISSLKERRIEEEGNLVRAQVQRKTKEIENEPDAKKRRFEDMVEEFPDELVEDSEIN